MATLAIVLGSFFGFFVAYHSYGRWLSKKIFQLDNSSETPSHLLEDGVDYVPTRKSVLFGHHFTSIAGTGPIVGPAIAVFWGWLPALIWVLVGSIFIGAVHDFSALVVSMRSRGQTLGDVAGYMISKRARLLFLAILFLVLMVVIAIFGLVIAVIFASYPQTVLSVWVAMPIAIALGLWVYKRQGNLVIPSLLALLLLYCAVYIGVYHFPITLGSLPLFAGGDIPFSQGLQSSVVVWTLILLVYCFIASVLPVWLLLQPRDYINSHQLFVALFLLVAGLVVARPDIVAPVFTNDVQGDPPIMPFLFITIACGAVSGFHCLVSSGTTSKQVNCERDAQAIGYGGMLMEGVLAVLVIMACSAGIGLGIKHGANTYVGHQAWLEYYGGSWADMGLGKKVGAFVEGGGNQIAALGIPLEMAIGIIAVMVACFAATTLDTATRLQRYVVQEIGSAIHVNILSNKYVATSVAVCTAGALALYPGPKGPGSGGLILWPLFGAINQLLAGLAFLVVIFYLRRHKKAIWFVVVPLALMLVLPAWAMIYNIFVLWIPGQKWILVAIGLLVESLQLWLVVEGILMWRGARGVLPDMDGGADSAFSNEGGRAC